VSLTTKHVLLIMILINFSVGMKGLFAAGIRVPLESVASLGEARSGGAAAADDASTNFYNPAGLVRIHNRQLMIGAIPSNNHQRFSGTMTNPGNTNIFPAGSPIQEGATTSNNARGIVTNAHFVYPLPPKLALGVSLLIPSGLGTNYASTSLVRYNIDYASIVTVELSPSIAYEIVPGFSVGVGLDELYMGTKNKTAVRTQPLTPDDSIIYVAASNYATGWHAGLLYEFSPATRVGLSYRSQIITHLNGTSKFYPSTGGLFPAGRIASYNFKTTIPIASLTTLSAYHEINSFWTIMGSIEREGWGIWQYDHAYNNALGGDVSQERKLRDTWYFALGSRYKINESWLIRGGIDYSMSSTTTAHRDILITDPSIIGFGIGLRYQVSPPFILDVAYSHGFAKTVRINNTATSSGTTLTGNSYSSGNSLGAELTWNMV